ncbi:MAG: hypothetical protein ACD_18C00080G0001 [uncultured bacterium]|nr:MAG: hypothetical protein ACD_18C00080G0001 [uncultured bacterium]
MFNSLNKEDIEKITERQIAELSEHLKATQKITLTSDAKALEKLVSKIKYEDYGARNVSSEVAELIQDLLIDNLKNKKKKSKYTLTYDKNYKLV